jgi:hypothetical protein
MAGLWGTGWKMLRVPVWLQQFELPWAQYMLEHRWAEQSLQTWWELRMAGLWGTGWKMLRVPVWLQQFELPWAQYMLEHRWAEQSL